MRVLDILPRSASLSLFDSSQNAGARTRKSYVDLERIARLCTIKSALCRVPDILCGGRYQVCSEFGKNTRKRQKEEIVDGRCSRSTNNKITNAFISLSSSSAI